MAKYSYELKKKIVIEYLNGEGGYQYLARKYDISQECVVRRWVNAYKTFGDDGLQRSRGNKNYTFEFKLSVVESYLTTEVSYQDLALKVGMNNPNLISKWVNDFKFAGSDALLEKRKGRKPAMDKLKNIDNNDDNSQYIKQLENYLLNLRIENAYLKELRRLHLEKEPLNKKRELSVVSEENSN